MELLINNRYKLETKIGQGAYGMIFNALDYRTLRPVAVKMESVNAPIPQIFYEAKIYSLLQGNKGIPRLFWTGIEGDYNVIVIEKLGPSLEALRKYCGGYFSIKTVCMILLQMIQRSKC